jgi:choline dehydrogenase-like flavoprotein
MRGFTPGKHSFEDYDGALSLEVDVAVLGAGAGGAAAAYALAKAGHTVAVLEEGRHWRPSQFQRSNPWALRNLYQDQGARAAMGTGGFLPVNGGKGVGGSTLINSAISFKTPPSVLKGWRENSGFNPNGDFEALLDEVWETVGVIVNPEPIQGRNNTIFKQGAEALGLKGGWLERGAPGCTGCGACQIGCPSGGKNSVDRTFLAKALHTGRVGVYADCRVEDLPHDGARVASATGRLMEPSQQAPAGGFEVKAKRFVLSGGPIGSPRLLMRAGLAPNEHVGQHLHFHPAAGVFGAFDEEILHWKGVSQGYYVDAWDEGYLLETSTVTPDLHYVGLGLPFGPELNAVMADLRKTASAGAMVHDEDTVGVVNAKSISLEFGEGDRRRMLAGLRRCAEVYFAAGARYVVSSVAGAGVMRDMAQVNAQLHEAVPFNRITAISSHPMGTCRTGDDPAESVVDPSGLVWGTDNLHVADASVVPSSLGVNPQITVMACGLMIGAEAAARV